MILRLAGEAGQVSLARCADEAGARASVDQHASEIRDALMSLPRETREALLLRADGYSLAEIARRQGIPVSTVKIRIHRLRDKIKGRMQ